MLDFLALITGKGYYRLHSRVIKFVLKCYGIRVGRNFYIEGTPKLKIKGPADNISIGDNVSIFGSIDIRNRENGKIDIGDGVSIDNDCRFVAANDATLKIGRRVKIGPYCIFNCGADVNIGEDCLISGMINIQASDHGYRRGALVREQRHTYGAIDIGKDVWIGFNASILKGARLGDGCVVGAKSLVREGEYGSHSVLAGVPASKIKERT